MAEPDDQQARASQAWEYAILRLRDEWAKGIFDRTEGIYFSHEQDSDVGDAALDWFEALGRGVKPENSDARFVHLNMGRTTFVDVLYWLGEAGWEMVAVQEGTVFFKRPLQPE